MQSSPWKAPNSPGAKKACQSKPNVKIMLIVFFDIEGIVRAETMCDENGRKSGRTDLCCNMTTLRFTRLLSSASFWLIKKLPCVLIYHTNQTWYPVVFGYSQKLN
jgi:hypothetical protein